MAELSINFTPVAGIASYKVCYNPAGSVNPPTCITVTGSPVLITAGITCGIRYDVTVSTLCPEGYGSLESSPVAVQTLALECEPLADGTCYTIQMPYETAMRDSRDLHIGYTNSTEGIENVSINMIPNFDTGDGIAVAVCSTGTPTFRYGVDGVDEFIPEINVTANGPCGTSSDCAPLI